MGTRERVRDVLMLFPAALARIGLVDRRKGTEAFDLAIPVMVTGGMRTLLRTADFFMVSYAVGDEAVAALEFGFQYYFIPFGLSLALSSGTISVLRSPKVGPRGSRSVVQLARRPTSPSSSRCGSRWRSPCPSPRPRGCGPSR